MNFALLNEAAQSVTRQIDDSVHEEEFEIILAF
jgi:hypothetical protein